MASRKNLHFKAGLVQFTFDFNVQKEYCNYYNNDNYDDNETMKIQHFDTIDFLVVV